MLPLLALGSRQHPTLEYYNSLTLTESSILEFVGEVKKGPNSLLYEELQLGFLANDFYQSVCLRYLIGSAAAFGTIDADVLEIFYGLCTGRGIPFIRLVMSGLYMENCLNTFAQVLVANFSVCNRVTSLGCAAMELIETDWAVVKPLILEMLRIMGNGKCIDQDCKLILRCLPIDQLCEMIDADSTPLQLIDVICSFCEFDPLLRERLASEPHLSSLQKRTGGPNPNRSFCLEQRQSKHLESKDIKSPCAGNLPALAADAWSYIFDLLDVGTLLTLPLVCQSWSKSLPRVAARHKKIQELYLEDLSYTDLWRVHIISPLNLNFQSRAAHKYFGLCIIDGAIGRIESRSFLDKVQWYVEHVANDGTLLPKIKNCTVYECFQKLLEKSCELKVRLSTFFKPEFLTDGEYESAVRYLVGKEGAIVRLSESIFNDLPKLFDIVGRKEAVMKDLIYESFSGHDSMYVLMIMYMQMCKDPDVKWRYAGSFRTLTVPPSLKAEPMPGPEDYFKCVVDSGLLLQLAVHCHPTSLFQRLIAHILLFFREDQDRISAVVTSMLIRPWSHNGQMLDCMQLELRQKLLKVLVDTTKFSQEDIGFFRKTMKQFGLSEQS